MDPTCVDDPTLNFVIGQTLSHGQQIVNVATMATVFGIATCLAIASVYILIARGVKGRSAALQLATILVLYTSTAVFVGAVLCVTFGNVNLTEATANALLNCDVDAISDSAFFSLELLGIRTSCIQTGTLVVNIIVGDAVVWWRVYMLWAGVKAKRVILGVSVMLLTATFAFSVVDTCGVCDFYPSIHRTTPEPGALFAGTTFGVVAACMSLVTNVVATCFTAYRAWVHVRSRKHFSQMFTLTGAEQILILVAESGFAYSAIWIVVVVWQGGENNLDIYMATEESMSGRSFWVVVGYFVNGGLVPVIAIYPMFIILMVALKRKCQPDWNHMVPTQIRFESQPPTASPGPLTAQGGLFNSSTRGLSLSSSSVMEACTSNSDLSLEELGKDVELREGCPDV
ncbi:hypothetical protein OH76DRAFT_1411472 [Lentinus brumalis]|uniref:G-protein coupled receptors family 1 profile domain-containing protein n=1 Tax=Lentinus brumalis TaxID=2498619 RepID=A0A371CP56_9APHY|nr:hypothetical protein OH76DRAFT_1411472 [Polyporus brumalis]